MIQRFHPLATRLPLPPRFTYPFCYEPHPLCLLAAAQLQRYLSSVDEWKEEIEGGKMFGVLVVENEGRLGFLAAYSGLLCDSNDLPYFVPAVYDMMRPDGRFKQQEQLISDINLQVEKLQNDPDFMEAKRQLKAVEEEETKVINTYKEKMRIAKMTRDSIRQGRIHGVCITTPGINSLSAPSDLPVIVDKHMCEKENVDNSGDKMGVSDVDNSLISVDNCRNSLKTNYAFVDNFSGYPHMPAGSCVDNLGNIVENSGENGVEHGGYSSECSRKTVEKGCILGDKSKVVPSQIVDNSLDNVKSIVENYGITTYKVVDNGLIKGNDLEDKSWKPTAESMEKGSKSVENSDASVFKTVDNLAKSVDNFGCNSVDNPLKTSKLPSEGGENGILGITHVKEADLVRESQFMKAELVRIKKYYRSEKERITVVINSYQQQVDRLKKERREKSDQLQRWLFRQFRMRNARGETRDLVDIFSSTPSRTPPSGAGECCAPKLLQYAFEQGLRPVCMAEFWWGRSPKTEIRHHLHYYPACRGKCKPILEFMMQGMDVDPDPQALTEYAPLDVLYEDGQLAVVFKPSGMLSVPGRDGRPSVLSYMRDRWAVAEEFPMIVHRLDMDTSGLMVVARTADAYHHLQQQFIHHDVKKRYQAILGVKSPVVAEGSPLAQRHGIIDLPLSADPLDRPRQVIDRLEGKRAITEYEVAEIMKASGDSDYALWVDIRLFPHTGRTHQLRVHCASAEGMGAPIIGDPLYGKRRRRLLLNAEYLEFTHPVTGRRMRFERPVMLMDEAKPC